MYALLAGLNSSSITRLKRTNELMSSKTSGLLQSLLKIQDPSKNNKAYWDMQREAQGPCLPYVGHYLTRILQVSIGNGDIINGQIHFNKLSLCADQLREVSQFQKVKYHFVQVTEIQQLLTQGISSALMDDDKIYQWSLQVEPRETEHDRMARNLIEVGMM